MGAKSEFCAQYAQFDGFSMPLNGEKMEVLEKIVRALNVKERKATRGRMLGAGRTRPLPQHNNLSMKIMITLWQWRVLSLLDLCFVVDTIL